MFFISKYFYVEHITCRCTLCLFANFDVLSTNQTNCILRKKCRKHFCLSPNANDHRQVVCIWWWHWLLELFIIKHQQTGHFFIYIEQLICIPIELFTYYILFTKHQQNWFNDKDTYRTTSNKSASSVKTHRCVYSSRFLVWTELILWCNNTLLVFATIKSFHSSS